MKKFELCPEEQLLKTIFGWEWGCEIEPFLDETGKEVVRTLLEDVLPTEKEKRIIRLRFGFIPRTPEEGLSPYQASATRTYKEIGIIFNVTRERIRQMEARAIRKLRHPSRSQNLIQFLPRRD
jgi:RNA polymerase sigma factor (sigma-70 family)